MPGERACERPAHAVIAWDELIEPPYAGPACTVVWQGRRGDSPPMPISCGERELRWGQFPR